MEFNYGFKPATLIVTVSSVPLKTSLSAKEESSLPYYLVNLTNLSVSLNTRSTFSYTCHKAAADYTIFSFDANLILINL